MAAQFITVDFSHSVREPDRGAGPGVFSAPGTIKIGPWVIDNERNVYLLMVILVTLTTVGLANLCARASAGRGSRFATMNRGGNHGHQYRQIQAAGFLYRRLHRRNRWRVLDQHLAAISPEHFPWSWSLWLVGVILIGGVGSLYGTSLDRFSGGHHGMLTFAVMSLGGAYPELLMRLNFVKESAFGLAICGFLLFEPNGLAYVGGKSEYFNLWPFLIDSTKGVRPTLAIGPIMAESFSQQDESGVRI